MRPPRKVNSMNFRRLEHILLSCTNAKLNDAELSYLHNSFLEIEELWDQRHKALCQIDKIILGEAPLYGSDKKYIYAKAGAPSSFLYPSDFPTYNKSMHGTGKAALWKLLEQNNMIIVDLFPYALNEHDTASLTYQKLRKSGYYRKLCQQVFDNFTSFKIKKIVRQNPNVSILVRYKRVMDAAAPKLKEIGFAPDQSLCGYTGIYSTNMGVNRSVLASNCKTPNQS